MCFFINIYFFRIYFSFFHQDKSCSTHNYFRSRVHATQRMCVNVCVCINERKSACAYACMCVYVCVCVWVGVGVSEKTWMLLLERQLRIWLPPIQTCFTWSLFSTPFSYPDVFCSLFDGERLDKKWMAGKAWKILNDVISWHYKVPWNLSYFQQQQQQHIQLQQQRQH